MRISYLELKNFKRFTHLTVNNIPESAKLVLLIGSNGSGKSSVFDAFRCAEGQYPNDPNYYSKDPTISPGVIIKGFSENPVSYSLTDLKVDSTFRHLSFFGRTSFRHIPRLSNIRISESSPMSNAPFGEGQLKYFIDKDHLFEQDIEIISQRILKEVFRSEITSSQIQKQFIEPINTAFEHIFGVEKETKLTVIEIIPPLGGDVAQINFRKGTSEIHYDLLSAGEKEVVNILFDLLVRREQYTDTIYYIDELDLHLNTKLQYNLIKEITENWIPEKCQLWTASHSLGFIDYASEAEDAVILDFDDLNFDHPQVIEPSDKQDYAVFELAVGKEFIDKIFQDKTVVFAENKDTQYYNDLSFRNTFFFIANDKLDVFLKSKNYKNPMNKIFGLVDRDYLLDSEILELKTIYPNIKILPYYSIENLFYHPDNILEHWAKSNIVFDIDEYKKEIIQERDKRKSEIILGIVQARNGYPFYKENENAVKLKQFRNSSKSIVEMLESDDFETFYSIFPAKDFGREIQGRQNLKKTDLAKTNWFRKNIEIALSS